jgi:hypothetical protein
MATKKKLSIDEIVNNFEKLAQSKKIKNITKKQFEDNLKKVAKIKRQSGSK